MLDAAPPLSVRSARRAPKPPACSSDSPASRGPHERGDRRRRRAGRHQRSAKNYLLDRHFQLKYTGLLSAIALCSSLGLGGMLWRTSSQVIEQSQRTVEQGRETVKQGQETVERGKQVIEQSRKVSQVVAMNIAKEYKDDPELAKTFAEDDAEATRRSSRRSRTRLEKDAAVLAKRARRSSRSRRATVARSSSELPHRSRRRARAARRRHRRRGHRLHAQGRGPDLQDEAPPPRDRRGQARAPREAAQGRRAPALLRDVRADGRRICAAHQEGRDREGRRDPRAARGLAGLAARQQGGRRRRRSRCSASSRREMQDPARGCERAALLERRPA